MIILNAKVITWEKPNRILENCALIIKDGKIKNIGGSEEICAEYPGEELLDARGQYVMPGNICAHTHFYGAFARGMSLSGSAPDGFPEILKKLWWRLDRALDQKAVELSALVCLVDAIKHGTTTLIDHHASPNAITNSLDTIAKAVIMSGLRASLCYEVTDRNGEDGTEEGIRENLRFIHRLREEVESRSSLNALFGLHASLTLSEKTLGKCRELAPDDTGFHIHVAEHSVDQYDSLKKSGTRVVDRLNRFGILGKRSIAVHAVHVDAREMEILSETQTWVTHQPRSNMNNAVGLPEVEAMMRMGVKVCLGNDGFSNAMWEEWKAAYLVHKAWHHDPRRMNAMDLVNIAIYNNAELASQLFEGIKIGVVEKGAVADLIFVDYHPFTPLNIGNLPWHIVFGFHESQITSTIVNGKILMHDRKLLTLDEEEITFEARKIVPDVWKKYQNIID
jgi:putative selenium metabolism protein SsnA